MPCVDETRTDTWERAAAKHKRPRGRTTTLSEEHLRDLRKEQRGRIALMRRTQQAGGK